MKRILTIQDISCLGKCSATIALPVLSAMGIETVVLPTALLSTHTGFKGNTFLSLTDELLKIAEHWKAEKVRFDAVYTGYLGSEEEVGIVKEIAGMFCEDGKTCLFVDPVMGDHGRLYRGFKDSYVEEVRSLCAMADVIIPNRTEACLLAGMPYLDTPTREDYEKLLAGIAGPEQTAAITGAVLADGMTGIIGMDRGRLFSYQTEKIPVSYHGTGDLFASTAIGGLLRGLPAERAMRFACDYTSAVIVKTALDTARTGEGEKYGLLFENTIPELTVKLEEELRKI